MFHRLLTCVLPSSSESSLVASRTVQTDASELVPAAIAARPAQPEASRWAWRSDRSSILILLGCLVAVASGSALRDWVWEVTEPIHYSVDMDNALHWGRRASTEGYLNLYENVVREGNAQGLDYVPLRLLLMTQWAQWFDARRVPGGAPWVGYWSLNAPLLMFNLFIEAAA